MWAGRPARLSRVLRTAGAEAEVREKMSNDGGRRVRTKEGREGVDHKGYDNIPKSIWSNYSAKKYIHQQEMNTASMNNYNVYKQMQRSEKKHSVDVKIQS